VRCEVHEVIAGAFDEVGDHSEEMGGWRRAVSLVEGARIRGKVVLGAEMLNREAVGVGHQVA
jgi:hypothetical protein